jgi:hypothetical protein
MRIPDGYDHSIVEIHNVTIDPKTRVQLLDKAINGLVQVARQWWKTLEDVLAACDYYPSKLDP